MEPVGFGPRLAAAAIDAVIVLVGAVVLGFIFGFIFGGYLVGLLISILALGYMSLEIYKAATPGKMLLQLQIRNEDGSPAAQETLIKRFVVKESGALLHLLFALTTIGFFAALGGVAGVVIFAGCFLVLFDERKQALHDRAAKTKVFKIETAAG